MLAWIKLYKNEELTGTSNGTPLQHSCLENPMDGGAWWAVVHGVTKSQTWLEQLHFHFSLACIGEGNGNSLQCSCLENPRDGGASQAAVYGVAQSRTRLKRLSSGSRDIEEIKWLLDVLDIGDKGKDSTRIGFLNVRRKHQDGWRYHSLK